MSFYTNLFYAKDVLASAFTNAKETAVTAASYAKGAAVSNVRAIAQYKAEEFIQTKSEDMGSFFKNELHNLIYKEKELVGKVKSTGELVDIYKVNPHLIQTIVKKATGFDVEAGIPFLPNNISKLLFSKLDALLVAKLEETVMKLSSQSSKISLIAVSKAAGASQEFLTKQLSKISEKDNSAVLSDKFEKELLNQAKQSLSEDQISDLNKLTNHYLAKLKIYVNQRTEEAVSNTATYYAGELVDNGIELAENYVKAGIGSAAIISAGALNPTFGTIVSAALYADNKVEIPGNESYISQISKYVTSHFFNKYTHKSLIQQAAHNNALITAQKNMPTALALNADTYKDAYGTYKQTPINDLDMSFVGIEQDEAPMTLINFVQKIPANAINFIKEIPANVYNAYQEAEYEYGEALERMENEEAEYKFYNYQNENEFVEPAGNEGVFSCLYGWFNS